MNHDKRKTNLVRKIVHVSVIISLIISILVFGFEKQPEIKAASYGVDYFVFTSDEYENPYIGNIQNNSIKFLNGKMAYCLQSGKDLKKGVNYTLKEDLNWSLESKELLAYVLYYGYQEYHGTSAELYSDEELSHYLATQLLVWQLEYNSFYDTKLKESLLEHYSDLKTIRGVQIGPKIIEYYNDIWTKADIALNGGTPSFTSDSDYIASLNGYIMEYNDEKEGFYLEIEDTNHYLDNYQVMEHSGLDVNIIGDKITIFSKEEIIEDKGIILQNPYFSKGMDPVIWTCNDLAYQNLANGDEVIDISKMQYIYVRTGDAPEPEEDTPSTDEDNPEPQDDTPSTDEDTPEPEDGTPSTGEDTPEPEDGTPSTEENNPEPEDGTPGTEEDNPEPEDDIPSTEEDNPEPEDDIPSTEEDNSEPEKNITTELNPGESDETPNSTKDIYIDEEYQYNNSEDNLPEGRIIIEKIDGDTKETLSGVKFKISNYDNSFSILRETDENGIIDITLPYDNYYLQEISASPGYATNNEKISFRIANEIPLVFQIKNSKVPQLGMNFSVRNIGFTGLLIFLFVFLFREIKKR